MLSRFFQDSKYVMFPILVKDIPHFLGAATMAMQTITQHWRVQQIWNCSGARAQVPAEVTCIKLSCKPGKSQCTSMTFFTRL